MLALKLCRPLPLPERVPLVARGMHWKLVDAAILAAEKGMRMSRVFETGMTEKLTLLRPVGAIEPLKGDDPVRDLLTEFQEYESEDGPNVPVVEFPPAAVATQNEDQIWLALDKQLGSLREGLQRMHFYLSDVDDSIRR